MSTDNNEVRGSGGADPQPDLIETLRGLQDQMRDMRVVMDRQQQELVAAGLTRSRSEADQVRDSEPE